MTPTKPLLDILPGIIVGLSRPVRETIALLLVVLIAVVVLLNAVPR